MSVASVDVAADAAATTPLEDFDVGNPELFYTDSHWPWFARLRREDPVHFCADSEYGPYWSITKYKDIMAIDTNHTVFSSEAALGGANLRDWLLPMFIASDPPKHEIQRKTVSPLFSQSGLAALEPLIREKAIATLDRLPVGETFDWVDLVSTEITTYVLATLLDFPLADSRKLAYWSDVATAEVRPGTLIESEEQRHAIMGECFEWFLPMWRERAAAPQKNDLVSLLAHGEATRNMTHDEFIGNVFLLIVGGNDTSRHAITGGLLALNEHPSEYRKLQNDHSLIASLTPEIVRWQTPLAHMRRTATADVEVRGKRISAGDKVVMWYVSGNRDEEAIENPDAFIIDRARPRQHLSYGFGIHRCIGSRLAELQLRIVWEEILKRWSFVEVVGEPHRVYSSFVKGFESLPVRIVV